MADRKSELRPSKGLWVLPHCKDTECGSLSVAMVDSELREIDGIEDSLVPVIDLDVDQALEMASTLITMARSRLIVEEGE